MFSVHTTAKSEIWKRNNDGLFWVWKTRARNYMVIETSPLFCCLLPLCLFVQNHSYGMLHCMFISVQKIRANQAHFQVKGFTRRPILKKKHQDNKLYNAILHVLMLGCKNWRIYLITLPWLRCYGFLYNEINARALIGQSAVGYCASKPMEKSREEDFVKKCGSWFTNSSRVLPTSRVVYQPVNHRNLWSIA